MNHNDYLNVIDETIAKGRYKDNWESLSGHKTPEWYYKGKFGIFIHWGIYSVPAHANEWYSRNMYDPNHEEYEYHRINFGSQDKFGYKDFIPMFKGENFNAENWVHLFKEAGAKFVMPVCEHHDGFAMYDTDFNKWNAASMGPCRNVIGEIKEECENEGLTFCASSHRAEHYFFMGMGRACESDVLDEEYRDFYGPAFLNEDIYSDNIFRATDDSLSPVAPTEEWLKDWLVRTCELIDRYQPSIIYFDWWIHHVAFKPYLKKLCAYYYNRAEEWGKEVTINYKHEAFPPTVATFDVERGALTGISPVPWQTDTAIGKKSWGYTKDNEFKTSRQLICDLIDIVSKNGMLLLNIGPKPDGTFTNEETEVLKEIGSWMAVNSEGIYDTVPWKTFGEGEVNNSEGFFQDGEEKPFTASDYRFTYKKGFLYVFSMRPSTSKFLINSLKIKGDHDLALGEVTVLGEYKIVERKRDEDGLSIVLDQVPESDKPICFKIELS